EEIFYVTLPAVEEKDYFVISRKKSDLFINNLIKENKNIEIYDINGRNVDNKRIKKGIYYLLIKEKNIFRKLIII
ncbi:MAG: hypothetical protein NC926_09800, partial [Candidatus Omnitrophica bacterium]|nr:hypothetical protein [Candidatus Omnitrophota bacterium]